MNRILVLGSLNFDNIYTVPHITQPGETLSSLALNIRLGGKGYNQAVAARQSGAEVWLAGMVGEDGQAFVAACNRLGIHTDYLEINEHCKTGHAIIQVNQEAENSILLHGGANQELTQTYIDWVLSHFGKDDYILLQNEVNNMEYIINRAYDLGIRIVLNPSPFDNRIARCDIKKVSWLFVNEIEAKQIAGNLPEDKLLEVLHFKYPDSSIVLTLGGNGADCFMRGTKFHQKAFPVKPVDTTGAGDCFSGYFIGLLTDIQSGRKALRVSAAAAALCITKDGAAESIPTIIEVMSFIKNCSTKQATVAQ